jgi:hypothetical protein
MTDILFLDKVEQFRVNRVPRKGLKGQWRHEFLGTARHDHMHISAGLDHQAQQLNSLVDSNASGYAQYDTFTLQHVLLQ